jgi:hypothetical protein
MVMGSHFRNSNVSLDGQMFKDCTFEGCTLVYSGGPPPSLSGCNLGDSKIKFTDAAERTLAFLKEMARPGSGLQKIIFDTFPFLRGN